MAVDKYGVRHRTWTPRARNDPPPAIAPEREHRDRYKTVVDEPEALDSLTDREKSSRYWLKSHGDDWIERALMGDLMDHRAGLIYENNAASRANPYRTTNLARRLKIHASALSAWSALRQFPKSFASWRRLCRALGLSFEIIVRDKQTGKIIFQGTK